MQYRRLGKSGLKVSTLSLGAWVTFGDQFGEDVAYECMKRSFDAGVNFFDNAEAYAQGEAETIMGKVLKRTGWKRSEFVISTKIFWGGTGVNERGLSRKHIIEGTDAALKRLQLGYVDLIFCHRPDIHTPIEETVRAMSYLVDSGRAFYWGTSEWSAEQLRQAYGYAEATGMVPPTMEQPQYNMFHRERVEQEYAMLYCEKGLGTTIWSPLASGLLTGKYNDGIPKDSRLAHEKYEWLRQRMEQDGWSEKIEIIKKLGPIAKELNCSLTQLAIAWCAANENVSTVITGASHPEQIDENMKSMEIVEKLTPEVMEKIERALDNKPAKPQDWRGV